MRLEECGLSELLGWFFDGAEFVLVGRGNLWGSWTVGRVVSNEVEGLHFDTSFLQKFCRQTS